jgi:hypothetical protein
VIDYRQVYDYGLIVPEGTDIEDFAPDLKQVIEGYKAEFPSAKVFGTQAAGGYQVIYVRMQQKLTPDILVGMFMYHNLDWQVIGIRSAYKIVEIEESVDTFGNIVYRYEYDEVLPINKKAVLPFVPGATMETPLTVPVYLGTEEIRL